MTSLEYNHALKLLWIILSLILFGFVFFRFSKGTGKIIFGSISTGLGVLIFLYPPAFLYAIPFSLLLLVAGEIYGRKKQDVYQMAEAKFEGGGIKRGLSAVEAAVILAYPVDKIVLLVILGMLRKKFIYFERSLKINIHVNEEMKTQGHFLKAQKRTEYRRHGAQKLGEVLLRYEEPFLELIEQEDGKELININFGIAFIPLVQIVAKRLDGYDLIKTTDYYQPVIQKISKEIRFPVNHETYPGRDFDKNLEWILLNENYLEMLKTLEIRNFPQWFSPIKTTLSSWIKELNDSINISLAKDDSNLMARRYKDKISTVLIGNIAQSNHNN